MNHRSKVESLLTPPTRVAIGKLHADCIEEGVVGGDRPPDDQWSRIIEGLADVISAGNLADTGMTRIISQDDDVPGK